MREYGSEHPAIVIPDGYFENLTSLGFEVTYLRSGREALLYVSCNCKTSREAIILFPAYCCWSMSAPFEKTGWKIVYYRLNEDLTVDEKYLEYLLKTIKVDAILTMNFYGCSPTHNIIAKIKSEYGKIVLIEDFSHCTFSVKQIFNKDIDFYVSSIRKSIGVCDGAILLSKNKCNNQYIQSPLFDFSDKRYYAQVEKRKYNYSKDFDSKNYFLNDIRESEGIINEFNSVRPISEKALKMLGLVNSEDIAFARKQNMRHLWTLLNGKVKMISGLERCFEGAPFSLPILVSDQEKTQKCLAKNGIYAPVLWPICDEAKNVCENSKYISEHMLSIAIDQRYNWDDIEDMAEKIINNIR